MKKIFVSNGKREISIEEDKFIRNDKLILTFKNVEFSGRTVISVDDNTIALLELAILKYKNGDK